jgi:hypothetical protein
LGPFEKWFENLERLGFATGLKDYWVFFLQLKTRYFLFGQGNPLISLS